MNSQENNWAINKSGESSLQVNSLLSVDFKRKLNRKLDEKIASLEIEIAEITAKNTAWKDSMKTRCAKIKETKKELDASKKRINELEKTRDNIRQSAEGLTEYTLLLKASLKKYREENVELEKEHIESLEDMENKWKIYQAEYEMLPLAVVRSKEQTALNKNKIELMSKQYKLAETKKVIEKQKENDTKRSKNLIIECAELYKESKLEDIMTRVALTMGKNLQEEFHRQETMITELTKKRKEQLVAKQQSVVKNSDKEIVSLFTPSQRRWQQLPRFVLSAVAETLTQPMPTFCEDYDTFSITSSVIDNLIESGNLPSTETCEYGPSKVNNQTSEVAILNPNNKAITVEEDRQILVNDHEERNPSANQCFQNIDNEEEASKIFNKEFAAGEQVDTQETKEYNSPKTAVEEVETGDEEFHDHVEEEASGTKYSVMSEASREKTRHSFLSQSNCPQQRELGEARIKRPRIMNIENVQLNVTPHKPTNMNPSQKDSLARYFATSAASSVDYNWKANQPHSSSSFQYSQKGNADAESNLGSEESMQFENTMKKFQISFLSDHEDREMYASEVDNNQPQYVAPRAINADSSQPKTAVPLLNNGNLGTPTSRSNKKGPFFLSMF